MSLLFNKQVASQVPNLSTAAEIEVPNAPTDSISCLKFSTSAISQTYLIAGSWDKSVRIWEITESGILLRGQKALDACVLDCCWSQDNSKAFIACTNNSAYIWDIMSDQLSKFASHDQPIKTIHYIQSPNYACVMTGSWDKKIKIWDPQNPNPVMTFDLSEKVYCADVHYPMAVVATADRKIHIFDLTGQPKKFSQMDSKLSYQTRCIKIFLNKDNQQPQGFIIGSIEGRVAVQFIEDNGKNSFTFKCHRNILQDSNIHEIFALNEIIVHPIHQTIVTIGSDGKISYWDKVARTKLKNVEPNEKQSITTGAIDSKGSLLAYAFGYDWTKGHEYNDSTKKPRLFIRQCNADLTPVKK